MRAPISVALWRWSGGRRIAMSREVPKILTCGSAIAGRLSAAAHRSMFGRLRKVRLDVTPPVKSMPRFRPRRDQRPKKRGSEPRQPVPDLARRHERKAGGFMKEFHVSSDLEAAGAAQIAEPRRACAGRRT